MYGDIIGKRVNVQESIVFQEFMNYFNMEGEGTWVIQKKRKDFSKRGMCLGIIGVMVDMIVCDKRYCLYVVFFCDGI